MVAESRIKIVFVIGEHLWWTSLLSCFDIG